MVDWSALLEERNAWVAYNFPGEEGHIEQSVFGVIEEIGELTHCHLKSLQNVRMGEGHEENAKDAIGDIMIYLLGVMKYEGHVPQEYEFRMDSPHTKNPNQCILWLASASGRMASRCAQRWSLRNQIEQITAYCQRYCQLKGWDFDQIVMNTWKQVSQRDWIKYPETGRPPQNDLDGHLPMDESSLL